MLRALLVLSLCACAGRNAYTPFRSPNDPPPPRSVLEDRPNTAWQDIVVTSSGSVAKTEAEEGALASQLAVRHRRAEASISSGADAVGNAITGLFSGQTAPGPAPAAAFLEDDQGGSLAERFSIAERGYAADLPEPLAFPRDPQLDEAVRRWEQDLAGTVDHALDSLGVSEVHRAVESTLARAVVEGLLLGRCLHGLDATRARLALELHLGRIAAIGDPREGASRPG